jgi:hypothetical protein
MCGPHNRFGLAGEEKVFVLPLEILTTVLRCPAYNLVTILAELPTVVTVHIQTRIIIRNSYGSYVKLRISVLNSREATMAFLVSAFFTLRVDNQSAREEGGSRRMVL